MDTLTLPTVPPTVTDARDVFTFQVTDEVLREAQAPHPHRHPEAALRALGHDMADTRREAFRVSVHADLPAEWIRSEAELLRVQGGWETTVRVTMTVEPPEPLGAWDVEAGKAPTLIRNQHPECVISGYCTVDGRPVYYPRP